MAMQVRAVVLCWNNREVLPRTLEHLLATDHPADAFEVVVVDNGSTDGSVDGWAARYPDVRLVETGENLGFAGGVNAGLTDLEGLDAVALVNSDAFVEPGWLSPLVAALEADPEVGAASPKILFADVDPPTINNVGTQIDRSWVPGDRGYGEPDRGQYDQEEDVWGWCGAAVLLRRSYLDDVGHFDPRLFMYAEDTDLSWRGAKAGWRYRYVPSSVVHHLHRASSGGERTPLLDHLNRRNRLVVVTRHGGLRGALGAWTRALGGIVAAIGTDVLADLVRGRRPDTAPLRRRVRAALDAARLLLGGSPGLPPTPAGRRL
ncbi:MAG: glycosyltransferase family 2 protein [Acidimicrobiales bacterium]